MRNSLSGAPSGTPSSRKALLLIAASSPGDTLSPELVAPTIFSKAFVIPSIEKLVSPRSASWFKVLLAIRSLAESAADIALSLTLLVSASWFKVLLAIRSLAESAADIAKSLTLLVSALRNTLSTYGLVSPGLGSTS